MVGFKTTMAVNDVLAERVRQERICLEKREAGGYFFSCADDVLSAGDKLAVLMEEVGEVAQELCEAAHERRAPSDNLRVELIQVAAVATAWAESLDNRRYAE